MLVILKITLIFTVLTCVVFIRLNNPILYYLYLLIILKYLVQHLFLLNLKSGTKRLGYSLMINFKRNFWCQKNHIAIQIFVKKYRNQNYVEFFFPSYVFNRLQNKERLYTEKTTKNSLMVQALYYYTMDSLTDPFCDN